MRARGLLAGVVIFAFLTTGCGVVSPGGTGNNATGTIDTSPSSLTFGPTKVGATSAQWLEVENKDISDLILSEASVEGAGFTLDGMKLPTTIRPGGKLWVLVKFTPSSSGTITGQLSLGANGVSVTGQPSLSADGVAHHDRKVPLKGIASSAQISVTPSSLAFGSVTLGTSGKQSLTVSNTGSADLSITAANVTGSGFSTTGLAMPMTVVAGGSGTITVEFVPSAAGSVAGNLSLVSNSPTSPTSISLTGSGSAAVTGPRISVSPTTLAFGSVTLGTSGKQSLTVSNTGSANLSITAANVTGSGFSTTGLALPMTVAAGGSGTITVQFMPLSAGSVQGTLSIVSNAPTSPTVVPASGAAVTATPPLQITTASLPGGRVGSAYSTTLAATGGVPPYTWRIDSGSLPAGLALNGSTGGITGTPSTAGAFSFAVSVTDSTVSGNPTQGLSIAVSSVSGSGGGGSSQNPLTYNAVTDILAHNSPAPTLGAAGTTTVDPDYGTTVLRVTQGGICGQASNGNFSTQDAGWSPIISVDDSGIIFAGDQGDYFWHALDLSTMSESGSCINVVPNLLASWPTMSRKTPNLVYGLSGNVAKSAAMPAGTVTTIHDMSTIPGFSISSIYLLYVDANDNWFCSSNNYQDTGTRIGCYNKSTGNTMVLNLGAATWQSNNGSPVALDNLTATQLTGCGVHEFLISGDGTWMHVEMNGCSKFPEPQYNSTSGTGEMYWEMGTNHVTYAVNYQSGHQTMGNGSSFIEEAGSAPSNPCSNGYNPGAWIFWQGNNLGSNSSPNYVQVNSCSPLISPGGHMSWLNNANDSYSNQYPFLGISQQQNTNIGAYLEWEVFMVQMQSAYTAWQSGQFQTAASGTTIWRIAHTYNDPTNSQCSLSLYNTPSISTDGKYIAFLSDWRGQTGAGTCANNRRTDIFIAQLPLP